MNPMISFSVKKVFSNCFMNYSMSREAVMLQKMIKKNLNKKKPQTELSRIVTKGLLSSAYDNENCSNRMTVLNKNYMENINGILSNTESGRYLIDSGIEVTKVKISRGYNFLNVYYASKNINSPENINNEALNAAIFELQKEIGKLRYTRRVPYLRFIRDTRLEDALKIEKIFEVMDFGKEYEQVNEKKVVTSSSSTEPDSLPEMRQNVYGVDVTKIKEKISSDILRFKTIDIKPPETGDDFTAHEFPQKLIRFSKQEFCKFYKKRRIEELKRKKMEGRELNSLEAFEYKLCNDKFDYGDTDDYNDTDEYNDTDDCNDIDDFNDTKYYNDTDDYNDADDYRDDKNYYDNDDKNKCKNEKEINEM